MTRCNIFSANYYGQYNVGKHYIFSDHHSNDAAITTIRHRLAWTSRRCVPAEGLHLVWNLRRLGKLVSANGIDLFPYIRGTLYWPGPLQIQQTYRGMSIQFLEYNIGTKVIGHRRIVGQNMNN